MRENTSIKHALQSTLFYYETYRAHVSEVLSVYVLCTYELYSSGSECIIEEAIRNGLLGWERAAAIMVASIPMPRVCVCMKWRGRVGVDGVEGVSECGRDGKG